MRPDVEQIGPTPDLAPGASAEEVPLRRDREADLDAALRPAGGDGARQAAPATLLASARANIGGPLLQHKLQRRLLQRRAREAAATPEAIHAAADRGTSGAGQALPHLDAIQRSFGAHRVDGVTAHTGAEASAASAAMGAEAFAVGDHVGFAGTPSLHTAAHEAAHVIQQRAGVSLKGGVGEEGDAHERHADQVADAVVRGETAQPLLDQYAAPAGPASGDGQGVQRKPGARVQLDKTRTPDSTFDQGHEKQGSFHSTAKAQILMDAKEDERAKQIQQALTKYDDSVNTVQRIAMWLTGPSIKAHFALMTGQPLEDAIIAKFGDVKKSVKTEYLLDIAEHGQPSSYAKLLIALGLLHDGQRDPGEAMRLIEAAPPAEAARIAFGLMPAIKKCSLGDEWLARVEAALKVGVAARREEADKKGGDQKAIAASHEARIEAEVQHLSAIVRSSFGALNVDHDKLYKDITDWVKKNDFETRKKATEKGSSFIAALNEALSKYSRFDEADGRYVIDLVRTGDTARHVAKLPDRMLSEQAKEQRQKDPDHEDASTFAVNELRAYVKRKGDKDWALKTQDGYKPLKARLEAMSDGERDGVLFSYMDAAQKAVFADPDVSPDVLEPLRKSAMEKLKLDLVHCGMEADDAEKILRRFEATTTRGALDKNTIYGQLRSLKSQKTYVKHKTLLHLLGKANGADFYNIRNDASLVSFIVGKLDEGKEKQKMLHLLGLKSEDEVEAEASRSGRDDKVEQVADEAELSPLHWKVRLGQVLGEKSATDAFLVVNQIYYAAQRAVAKPNAAHTVLSFMMATMPLDSRKLGILMEDHFRPAYNALTRGTYVNVDEQLKESEFHGLRNIRRVGGNDAKQKTVVASFESLSGKELLKEWSNIDVFSRLKAEHDKLKGKAQPSDEEKKRTKWHADTLRDFILDVRDDRRVWLQGHFHQGDFVAVLDKLRARLRDAAANDDEFQQGLKSAGFEDDDYAQERMKGMAMIDEQRGKDSGLQVGMQWHGGLLGRARMHERKEARNELLGEFRSAQKDIRDTEGKSTQDQQAARKQVNEQNVPRIKDKEEQLAARTAAFERARQRAITAAKLAVAIILTALVSVATMGIGSIPMATATAIWVPILVKLCMATSVAVLKAMAAKALEGDNFNGRKAVFDVAMAVGTSMLGVGSDIATAQALNAADLLGATNVLHGGGTAIAQYAEAEAISTGMNVMVQQAIPEAIKTASQEDPGATSKWGHLVPLFVGFVEQFAVSFGKDLASDAATQNMGVFSAKQQNEWGGFNRDASGAVVKIDADSNVTHDRLTLLQTGEKVGAMGGITAAMTGVDKGLGKGLDKLDDALTPDDGAFTKASIPRRPAPPPTPPSQAQGPDPVPAAKAAIQRAGALGFQARHRELALLKQAEGAKKHVFDFKGGDEEKACKKLADELGRGVDRVRPQRQLLEKLLDDKAKGAKVNHDLEVATTLLDAELDALDDLVQKKPKP